MKYLYPILLFALSACIDQEETDPFGTDMVTVQLTGADGAAAGQVGRAFVFRDGRIQCLVISPTIFPNTPQPDPEWQTFDNKTLFPKLSRFVRANAAAGIVSWDKDFIMLHAGRETIAITPKKSNSFGLESRTASSVIRLVNDATEGQCLNFG